MSWCSKKLKNYQRQKNNIYSTTSKNLIHFAMSDTKGYLELSGFSVSSFSDLVQLIIISSNRFSLASKSARSGIKSK